MRTTNDLRCFCPEKPLLATYGIDEDRQLYIHVRIWKQNRIFGEMIVKSGIVKIHCRCCLRWHTVVMREASANLRPIDPPKELNEER